MRSLTWLPILLLAFMADQAVAKDCVLSAGQTAAVAKLPHPITRNAEGKWVQNGEVLNDDRNFELCNARHMYQLMVAREARGKRLAIKEISPFDFTFLSDAEGNKLKTHLQKHPQF
jgi:CxxC motif-containing protein (DUF1111 family)